MRFDWLNSQFIIKYYNIDSAECLLTTIDRLLNVVKSVPIWIPTGYQFYWITVSLAII